jgi:putative ABC transport system substrate-binding protein
MIARRSFLTLLGGAAAATAQVHPHAAFTQTAKRPLIGMLFGASEQSSAQNVSSFLRGMRELGYVDGRNYDIAFRYADGNTATQPALAEQLLGLNPDVIVTANSGAASAVKQKSPSIAIVSAALDDPVGVGLVESYSRPGGQVTGILFTIDTLPGKQIQLALEMVPGATKVGVLLNLNVVSDFYRKAAEAAARTLGVSLVSAGVRTAAEIDAAVSELAQARVDAMVILPNPLFANEGRRIALLAAERRVPALYAYRQAVVDGGLVSYGIDLRDSHWRVAAFVDRILKGEKPSDLPVELPTKFVLAINLKTARALGLEVPTTILLRADEVIE